MTIDSVSRAKSADRRGPSLLPVPPVAAATAESQSLAITLEAERAHRLLLQNEIEDQATRERELRSGMDRILADAAAYQAALLDQQSYSTSLEHQLRQVHQLAQARHDVIANLQTNLAAINQLAQARHEVIDNLQTSLAEINRVAQERHELISNLQDNLAAAKLDA